MKFDSISISTVLFDFTHAVDNFQFNLNVILNLLEIEIEIESNFTGQYNVIIFNIVHNI